MATTGGSSSGGNWYVTRRNSRFKHLKTEKRDSESEEED